MGLMYSASQTAQAITTAVDLFFLTVAADKPVKLHWLEIFQTTDLGDAAEEIIGFGVYRGVTGGGSGSALTEVALHSQNSVTAGTAVVGQGTASTGGNLIGLIGWNIRQAGPIYVPTPEIRPVISAAEDPIAVRFMAAPIDSITVSATIYWEES